METTHIPVMDIHPDGTVTPVPTCETCRYVVRHYVGNGIPPRPRVTCRLSGVHVALLTCACGHYHRNYAA